MGSSWWLFTGVLGFDALDVDVPLFGFLFLVALGVDYNIFLVTRAREEALTHGTREGMLRALAATGGVITSAGILLAAVFAVLGVLPLVVLAQLGVVIRSEEHTSELQSLMRISYAVFCLKKKKTH